MTSSEIVQIISRALGKPCPWCGEDAVESDEYKGTTAAVCQECETPIVREVGA